MISSPLALLEALGLDRPEQADPRHVRALLRKLTRPQLRELDALLGVPVETIGGYITRVSPGFLAMRWLDDVLDHLQMLADGILSRLIIEAPPRHGKSFVVSEHLPAYWLSRYPWQWVGLASHSASLALAFSRKARGLYVRGGGHLHRSSRAVQRWQTAEGDGDGGMWARGFDSGITGEGSGLMIIDDPVKSRKAIRTPQSRRDLYETYREVLYTRLEASGAMVVMATRWHKQDLTGQLLDAAASESGDPNNLGDAVETSDGWVLISRPAIARRPEEVKRDIPASVRVVPDRRAPGEPLAPERGYDLAKLLKIMTVVGPSTWGSLFQQDPRPADGSLFKWEHMPTVNATHGVAYRVRYWDLAKTEGEGDFTAGGFVSYAPETPVPVIVEDVVAHRYGPGRRNNLIVETARRDAEKYGADGFVIWIESLGKDDTKALVAALAGFIVQSETQSGQGDKEVRASPLASQAQVGNVALLVGAWNDRFREQACAFPNGENDDEVDAVAGAYNKALQLAVANGLLGSDDEWTPV